MKRILFGLLCALLLVTQAQAQRIAEHSLASPDKRLQLTFYQKRLATGKSALYYSLRYKDRQVINESLLDLQLDNHLSESSMALKIDRHEKWFENLAVTGISKSTSDQRWTPATGERAAIAPERR